MKRLTPSQARLVEAMKRGALLSCFPRYVPGGRWVLEHSDRHKEVINRRTARCLLRDGVIAEKAQPATYHRHYYELARKETT